ncbi:MAG: efflux RND transporter periplasmic adaptor subunit [Bacteroidales bacterium]|nr:efflux RND transporter periplasmic adaptor subunit [Bacteroidales bacterium]
MNKRGVFLMCALGCLMASCKDKEVQREVEPVAVEIMVVDSVASGVTRTYVGEVEENLSVVLSFAMGGTIQQMRVHEGDRVAKGTVLASVDKRNAQSAYDIAKATLDQAEDGYRRLKKLYDQGSVAEVKWVEMQTNLEKARSLATVAKKNLEDCEMTAPFTGVVGTCFVQAGRNVLPDEPVINLLDVQQVAVSFTVPENEISSVTVGQKVKVLVPAVDDLTFLGTVSSKSVSSDKIAHSYKVEVAVPAGMKGVLPGMVCKVMLSTTNDMGFVLPSNAVQTRSEGLGIWKIKNGRAVRQLIKTDEFVANGVRTNGGVELGDTIVVNGQKKLYDNAEVVVNKKNN